MAGTIGLIMALLSPILIPAFFIYLQYKRKLKKEQELKERLNKFSEVKKNHNYT